MMEDINDIMNRVIAPGETVEEMIVQVRIIQKQTKELEDYFGIKGIITILVHNWLDFFITITYFNHFKRIFGLSHLALLILTISYIDLIPASQPHFQCDPKFLAHLKKSRLFWWFLSVVCLSLCPFTIHMFNIFSRTIRPILAKLLRKNP